MIALYVILASLVPCLVTAISCPSANQALYDSESSTYRIDCGNDYNGGDMAAPNGKYAATLDDCIAQCTARAGCVAVNFSSGPKACYLKKKIGVSKADKNIWSAMLLADSGTQSSSSSILSTSTSSSSSIEISKSSSSQQASTLTSSSLATSSSGSTISGSSSSKISVSSSSGSSSSVVISTTSSTSSSSISASVPSSLSSSMSFSLSVTSSSASISTTSSQSSSVPSSFSSPSIYSSSISATLSSPSVFSQSSSVLSSSSVVSSFSSLSSSSSLLSSSLSSSISSSLSLSSSSSSVILSVSSSVSASISSASSTSSLSSISASVSSQQSSSSTVLSSSSFGYGSPSSSSSSFIISSSSWSSTVLSTVASSTISSSHSLITSSSSFATSYIRSNSSTIPSSTISSSKGISSSSTVSSTTSAVSVITTPIACPASNGSIYIATSSKEAFRVECKLDRAGFDMGSEAASTMEQCINICDQKAGCIVVSWVAGGNVCYMHSGILAATSNSGVWGAVQIKAEEYLATATTSSTSSTFDWTVPTSNDLYPNVKKRGLAYNDAKYTNFFDGSKVTWGYNWYSAPTDTNLYNHSAFNSNLQFIPMLWNATDDLTQVWAKNAQAAIEAGADHILAFNEPDQCGEGYGGSCMGTPEYVAEMYQKWVQPFAGKVKLGAPAVTNGGSPLGLTYLQNFMDACKNCTIDFIPIHWYDHWWNIDYLFWYVQEAYRIGGNRPIWITEYAPYDGDESERFWHLNYTLPWLDQYEGVERYSYFWTGSGSLVNEEGTGLSRLGKMYNDRRSSW